MRSIAGRLDDCAIRAESEVVMNLIDLADIHAAAMGIEEPPMPDTLLLGESPKPLKRKDKLAEFRQEPEPADYQTMHVVRLWPTKPR
jgi:hypothetical protein